MRQIDAFKILQRSTKAIFSFADIKKLLKIESDNTAYVQIYRLIKIGLLISPSKGVYYLAGHRPSDFVLANFLYQPSYISMESALNYYGILIQVPQIFTSISPRRSKKININGKEFIYSHLDSRYYFGYIKEKNFLIATPEKALIDTIFFAAFGRTVIHADELSWNNINKDILNKIAKRIKSKAFRYLFDKILR